MRAVWWIVACACGGAPARAPTNTSGPELPAKPAEIVEDCEPFAGGHPPGYHDRYTFEDPASGKTGYRDKAGVVVIAARFDHAYEFSPGGVAGVVDTTSPSGPLLFIAPDGSTIARAFAFDNGPDYFQEGLARIVDDRRRVGFLDSTGKIAIPPRFTHASPMCHGKSKVEDDTGSYFIDRRGQRTTPPPDPPPDAFDSGA